ncbi:hypothetical protein RBSH_06091 [Rhodopirellula baltica SH28]|uniref:Uncharacterized protein n=1 Tax=Rhodopirellula baltica SH28 TaxID=993517 RepID=K5D852_RHOBT|nr:hypothetical protein RBSH_06091 [Rhodopirellula baltica SH28]
MYAVNVMQIATAAWMNPSTATTAVAKSANAKVVWTPPQPVHDHVTRNDFVSS